MFLSTSFLACTASDAMIINDNDNDNGGGGGGGGDGGERGRSN